MRSAPVWEELVDISGETITTDHRNGIYYAANNFTGDTLLFASRYNSIHDIAVFMEGKDNISNLDSFVELTNDLSLEFDQGDARFNNVGNRAVTIGDGSANAIFVGKGPVENPSYQEFHNKAFYDMEWRDFPHCKYFVVGPNKSLYAAGDCNNPLTIYVSEPADITNPYRDNPFSDTGISQVELLLTNANEITGLSVFGTKVIVHTDNGASVLFEPKSAQASTGYRVEQSGTSVSSAAASNAVVNNSQGPMPFWLGHDSQIYKDESATRAVDEVESFASKDQASYKSKGLWDINNPKDLSNSFAAYDPNSGSYMVYIENQDYKTWADANGVDIPVKRVYTCPPEVPYEDADIELTVLPDPEAEPEDPDVSDPVEPEQPDVPELEENPPPDPDTNVPDPFTPPAPSPTTPNAPPSINQCGTSAARSGGFAYPTPDSFQFDLGNTCGSVTIKYSPMTVPDRFVFEYEGEELLDTGWVSLNPGNADMANIVEQDNGFKWKSNSAVPTEIVGEEINNLFAKPGEFTFTKNKCEAMLNINVYGPLQGTAWNVSASCPEPEEDCDDEPCSETGETNGTGTTGWDAVEESLDNYPTTNDTMWTDPLPVGQNPDGSIAYSAPFENVREIDSAWITKAYTECGMTDLLADALTITSQLEAWGVPFYVGEKSSDANGTIFGAYSQVENEMIMNTLPSLNEGTCESSSANAVTAKRNFHHTLKHESIHTAQDAINGILNSDLTSVLNAPSALGIAAVQQNYPELTPGSNRFLMEAEGNSANVDGTFHYVTEAFAAANAAIATFFISINSWIDFKKDLKSDSPIIYTKTEGSDGN